MTCRVDQLSKEPPTATLLPPWLPARGGGCGGAPTPGGPAASPEPGCTLPRAARRHARLRRTGA